MFQADVVNIHVVNKADVVSIHAVLIWNCQHTWSYVNRNEEVEQQNVDCVK